MHSKTSGVCWIRWHLMRNSSKGHPQRWRMTLMKRERFPMQMRLHLPSDRRVILESEIRSEIVRLLAQLLTGALEATALEPEGSNEGR